MNVRILLAEDHQMVREGLRALLEGEEDLEVIAETDDGRSAVEMTERLRPHVVVMDISMPCLNGLDATRHLARGRSGARVLILSMHADRRYVAEAFRAGAGGYVLKDGAFEELAEAVRIVARGGRYLRADLAGLGKGTRKDSDESSATFFMLTPREREVLQLLAEGVSNKEIAALLHVSVKTIETHRQHLMEKTGFRSIAELTKYALRHGLTDFRP